MEATTKNAVFWAVVPCRSCVHRRFGRKSAHTRSTQRHIPEDGILRSSKSLTGDSFVNQEQHNYYYHHAHLFTKNLKRLCLKDHGFNVFY
jgi:hypothetical protein